MDLGLLRKSKTPLEGGVLDLGLLRKSKTPPKTAHNTPKSHVSRLLASFARLFQVIRLVTRPTGKV